jgi:hypothetical protein
MCRAWRAEHASAAVACQVDAWNALLALVRRGTGDTSSAWTPGRRRGGCAGRRQLRRGTAAAVVVMPDDASGDVAGLVQLPSVT